MPQATEQTFATPTEDFVLASAHALLGEVSSFTLRPIGISNGTTTFAVDGVGSTLPGYETRITVQAPVPNGNVVERKISIRVYDGTVLDPADIPEKGLSYMDIEQTYRSVRRTPQTTREEAVALAAELCIVPMTNVVLVTEQSLF